MKQFRLPRAQTMATIAGLWHSVSRVGSRLISFLKLRPKLFILLGVSLLLSIGLSYSLFSFKATLEYYQPTNIDVSFINPHQAVVFWKTQPAVKGYLKIRRPREWRGRLIKPRVSRGSQVHAVEILELPPSGMMVMFQVESAPPLVNWFLPKKLIRYSPPDAVNQEGTSYES